MLAVEPLKLRIMDIRAFRQLAEMQDVVLPIEMFIVHQHLNKYGLNYL